jgi:hypothetical protein
MTQPILDRPFSAPRENSIWAGSAWLLIGGGAALALLLAFRPYLAVGCAALLALIGLCVTRPVYGLVAILAGIAFLGSDSILRLQTGIQWVEADFLLMAAALGWVIRMLARGVELRWSTLDRAVLLFGTMVVIGVFVGLSRGTSLEELRSELRPPSYLMLGYAIARDSIRDRRMVRTIFIVLTAVTVLSAIKTLVIYSLVPLGPAGGEERLVLATRVMNSDGIKRVIAHGAETYPLCLSSAASCIHARFVEGPGGLSASLFYSSSPIVHAELLGRFVPGCSPWCGHACAPNGVLWQTAGIAVTAICLVVALQSIVPIRFG